MSDYRGYPVVPCPDCGASDTVEIEGPCDRNRTIGPGEWTWYRCGFCSLVWNAIMPEPADRYEGDGVFAPNH